jgi:hypothetical protein
MTPEKQVSPAIRILRGERDASARATHLEAATRKFLVTTNERKYMSTTTNFKRIALVAVAALGLGVLSSVPSNATFYGVSGSYATISTTAGTAGLTGAASDSTTAGTFSLVAFAAAADDSFTVTSVLKSKPAGASAANPALAFMLADTATSSTASVIAVKDYPASTIRVARVLAPYVAADTSTSFSIAPVAGGTNAYIGGKWLVFMDSLTASTTRVAGTYVYTIIATPNSGLAQTVDISFVVTAAAEDSVTIAPGSSTAFIGTATAATSDAVISALATASTTPAAYVRVVTKNASGTARAESITATISGAGLLSFGGISGSSLTVAGTGGSDISVLPNGVAGTATITISTTTRTFPAKTMTFYAAAPTTLVASVATPLAAIGSNNDVVRVTAKDSAGVSWAGALYIYASTAADALIAGSLTTPVLCTWDANDDRHECPVSGLAAGTAKFKTINASTVAAATVTSNEVSVVVSQASAATVKLEFDKTSYAPGERARIYVTPLDSTGKAMPATAFSNLLATGGISTASALTFAGSTTTADSLTAVAITTRGNSSSTSGAKAGSFEYTVYMPVSGGTVTISATGGSSLPIAGRVAVTASATVTDSGAAALAAVTALSTTVASLKTLITTLTNLVLKIQKKVKA